MIAMLGPLFNLILAFFNFLNAMGVKAANQKLVDGAKHLTDLMNAQTQQQRDQAGEEISKDVGNIPL